MRFQFIWFMHDCDLPHSAIIVKEFLNNVPTSKHMFIEILGLKIESQIGHNDISDYLETPCILDIYVYVTSTKEISRL